MSDQTAVGNETAVKVKQGGKMSVKDLTTVGMMIGIILLMSFTPLGYLQTGGLSITLITIPVAIGAMLVGPRAGLILGLIFGCTSFYQALAGTSPFSTTLLNINPIGTFMVCVPTRALEGWLVGMIFKALEKIDKTKTVCFFIGGFLTAFLNTVLFMGTLLIFFWNTEFLQSINQGLGGLGALAFVFAFVGINGMLEMPTTCIVAGVVSKAVKKAFHKKVVSG